MPTTTRTYLRAIAEMQHGRRHESLAAWLLREGCAFEVRHDWPDDVPLTRGRPRECYRNCTLAALRYPRRFVYVEGMASAVIPVDHAWLWDLKTGAAYDPTWHNGRDYWGVPFSTAYLRRCVVKRKFYGLLTIDWRVVLPKGGRWRRRGVPA